MKITRLALILGDQLFPNHHGLQPDEQTLFFLAEDKGLCTHFEYHKHKLVLFLSAMRSHAAEVLASYECQYWELNAENEALSYEEKLAGTLKGYTSIQEIITYQIEDHFFKNRITAFCEKYKLKLTEVENPSFMTSTDTFKEYLNGVKKPFMHTFYQQQRKRLNMLVDESQKPLNGQWSFDADNRKKLPKKITVPIAPALQDTAHTKAVKAVVNTFFANHPGDTNNFWLCTTRAQVLQRLDYFLKELFEQFGPYEDAFEQQQVFIFHSVLSPYINMGLVTAKEVVDKAIAFAQEHNTHYPSLEGFVRQIIGWREFIRGMYHAYEVPMRGNYFNHTRKLTKAWYDGTTGITPLDDSIKKAKMYGYTHHIERLMVLGNMMLLCEIHPDEVNRWFMEMYVDSADWVMVPNVYGMSQFADGGIFATKPYICGANYWFKMSGSYSKKAEWVDIVNGLYWNFIEQKRDFFLSNPRMGMMVRLLDKMDAEKKERIFKAANAFVAEMTSE